MPHTFLCNFALGWSEDSLLRQKNVRRIVAASGMEKYGKLIYHIL